MAEPSLQTTLARAVSAFGAHIPLTELSAGSKAALRYPRLLPLMRFSVKRYAAKDYGNVFTMYTRAMGGKMQLCTLVFTPNQGGSTPLLLIDAMEMGKKRAVYAEYYDLTAARAVCPALTQVAAQYADLPNYAEKPAWYVAERTPYSLIKGGDDAARLTAMLLDSAAAYGETCAAAAKDAANLARLEGFVERMVHEGNPSSAVMEKVLGKAQAEAFFRTAIMPAQYNTEALV